MLVFDVVYVVDVVVHVDVVDAFDHADVVVRLAARSDGKSYLYIV